MDNLTDFQTLEIVMLALILVNLLVVSITLISQSIEARRENTQKQLVQKLELNNEDILLLHRGTQFEAAKLQNFIKHFARKDVKVVALREGQSLIKLKK